MIYLRDAERRAARGDDGGAFPRYRAAQIYAESETARRPNDAEAFVQLANVLGHLGDFHFDQQRIDDAARCALWNQPDRMSRPRSSAVLKNSTDLPRSITESRMVRQRMKIRMRLSGYTATPSFLPGRAIALDSTSTVAHSLVAASNHAIGLIAAQTGRNDAAIAYLTAARNSYLALVDLEPSDDSATTQLASIGSKLRELESPPAAAHTPRGENGNGAGDMPDAGR